MVTRLTNNFTLEELYASDTAKAKGIDNMPSDAVKENLRLLAVNVLQPIREKYGKPIKITSGYRCVKLNAAVGGSKKSQHITGCAADLKPVNGTVKELFDCIENLVNEGKVTVGQLIDEYGYKWVHVSYPSTSKKNQILHLK